MPPFSADDRDILAETSLFQDLPPEELAQLRASARPVHRPRGGYFFMQGDPLERMYLLVTGRIKITQLDPTGSRYAARARAGSLFGVVVLTGEGMPGDRRSARRQHRAQLDRAI